MTGKKRGEREEPLALDMDADEALERLMQADPAEADALAKEADAGQFVEEAEPHDTGDRLLPYVGKNGVEVELIVGGDTFWASQGQMAQMFGVHRTVISKHLKNIFEEGELDQNSVSAKTAHTAADGKTYQVAIYNLNALISVGYRVGSKEGTLFRIWATDKLIEFLTKGFVMDDERLKNPDGRPDYFDELLDRIRDIRSSEKRMWTRVLEFAEFCSDYDKKSETQGAEFFAEIQNTMHWAVLQKTAPELIVDRVHASKPNAGVVSFKGKLPTVKEAQTAKDLMHEPEITALNHITSLVLEFFESQVEQRRLTTLPQFVAKMRDLVKLDGRPVKEPGYTGKVTRTQADKWASDQIREFKSRKKIEAEAAGEKALKQIAATVKALPKPKKPKIEDLY